MALTYPLALADFADLLPIAECTFVPAPQQEHSGLGSGEIISADLGPMVFEADVSLRPLRPAAVRPIKARLSALLDRKSAFYIYDPLACYPTGDKGGKLLGASTVTLLSIAADRRSMALQGLPSGYKLSSDWIAIDYGTPSRRALVQMVGSVTAASDGKTAQFEVSAALRSGIVVGSAVMLKKPAIKAKIVPGSVTYEPAAGNRTRVRFKVRQTLQAG